MKGRSANKILFKYMGEIARGIIEE